MLMAISQRRGPEYGGADILEASYSKYFDTFDINLIPIPNIGRSIRKYFDKLKVEGIILTGGDDVHPTLYGGDTSLLGKYSPERDETERSLLEIAIKEDIPVLGICRGMQAINVYFGGTLIQSLERDVENAINHVRTTHEVLIFDDSKTNQLDITSFEVNSYHNLGLMKPQLSPELIEFATAKDLTIEAVYHPRYAIAAIMWHPERWNNPTPLDSLLTNSFASRKLFWQSRRRNQK